MMISNAFLLIFAVAFMGCVLATPFVTRIAAWFGAIDRPDQFRRIHKGATPRMGGLGLAFGLALGIAVVVIGGYLSDDPGYEQWLRKLTSVTIASFLVLGLGSVDDVRGVGPRVKLLCQALAVLVLFADGIRIAQIDILKTSFSLDVLVFRIPIPVGDGDYHLSVLSLFVTMFWFLACMNIWNLIDGMDGLASGVGLLVSGTLMLVAISRGNAGVAALAAALAGSLAGFLLYNWHPACIFLGDSGSLLIGLMIGVIGVQGSLKGPSAISILFPILAMGLPISDTAMAIFRRWVRNLPLSSADRRHVHHLLIGLGLNPRQAALLLYCFSGFLCGVVLLGVALRSEFLALLLGISGCLAFLLILTSRRNELATLRADFLARLARGKQERQAAKVTWEAIQRIELCDTVEKIWFIVEEATARLGCDHLHLNCRRDGRSVFERQSGEYSGLDHEGPMSGPTATFRLSSGRDLQLIVSLHQVAESELAADIAFRFLQRLSLATAERLERLLGEGFAGQANPWSTPMTPVTPRPVEERLAARPDVGSVEAESGSTDEAPTPDPASPRLSWLREALGWSPAPVARRTLGEE